MKSHGSNFEHAAAPKYAPIHPSSHTKSARIFQTHVPNAHALGTRTMATAGDKRPGLNLRAIHEKGLLDNQPSAEPMAPERLLLRQTDEASCSFILPALSSLCTVFDLVEHHALLRTQLDNPRPPQSVPAIRYVQCCIMVCV